jgi:hypothetical protein
MVEPVANKRNWKLKGITRPCPAREIVITDAISEAEEIMRKIEKSYPAK